MDTNRVTRKRADLAIQQVIALGGELGHEHRPLILLVRTLELELQATLEAVRDLYDAQFVDGVTSPNALRLAHGAAMERARQILEDHGA